MSRSATSASQRSSSNSSTGATCWNPAFGISASRRPKRSSAAATAALLPSRVVRSAANGAPGPGRIGLEVDREDVPAVGDEALRDGAADAARGARDERRLAQGRPRSG